MHAAQLFMGFTIHIPSEPSSGLEAVQGFVLKMELIQWQIHGFSGGLVKVWLVYAAQKNAGREENR